MKSVFMRVDIFHPYTKTCPEQYYSLIFKRQGQMEMLQGKMLQNFIILTYV